MATAIDPLTCQTTVEGLYASRDGGGVHGRTASGKPHAETQSSDHRRRLREGKTAGLLHPEKQVTGAEKA
jgi:hypothetical protein